MICLLLSPLPSVLCLRRQLFTPGALPTQGHILFLYPLQLPTLRSLLPHAASTWWSTQCVSPPVPKIPHTSHRPPWDVAQVALPESYDQGYWASSGWGKGGWSVDRWTDGSWMNVSSPHQPHTRLPALPSSVLLAPCPLAPLGDSIAQTPKPLAVLTGLKGPLGTALPVTSCQGG